MLDYYERGETAYAASQYDQRFGYYLYVPSGFSLDNASRYNLLVVIHGSQRTPQPYCHLFKEFAEAHQTIVMAPLFPAGIYQGEEEMNYKFMKCQDFRFDELLLKMVNEVRERYQLPYEAFMMHGFSGGGHFAHRFFYLHPRELRAVSIGAPGMVTLLDKTMNWHCGVGDFKQQFGKALDYTAMRNVAVQMVIGAQDTDTWEITIQEDDVLWMDGVNDAGQTRLDRLNALKTSFEQNGILVRHDVVEAVSHEGFKLLDPVKDFFISTLNQHHSDNMCNIG